MLELKKKDSLQRERCILIGIINKDQDEEKSMEYLEELRFLADTAGADTMHIFTQKLSRPDTRTFLGSGKMEEIKGYVDAENIDFVVFDDELTPSQLKNIEVLLEVKVMDRKFNSGHLCRPCANQLCTNPSRIGPISIPASTIDSNVDTP